VWSGGLIWEESNLAYLSSQIQAIKTKLPEMVGHVEKLFEVAIVRASCNNGVNHGKVFSTCKCWGACYRANKCDNYY
jgi:hypothetical protein